MAGAKWPYLDCPCKNCKIGNRSIYKALFSKILLWEGSQTYFMLAIGHFEILEKNTLRHSSDLDSVSSLQKKYGQVSIKAGDLAIDDSPVFQKRAIRSV